MSLLLDTLKMRESRRESAIQDFYLSPMERRRADMLQKRNEEITLSQAIRIVNDHFGCDVRDFLPKKTKATETHSLTAILEAVSEYYDFGENLLRGKNRKREIVTARHIAIYLMTALTSETLSGIGRFMKKDHASVLHVKRKITGQIPLYEDLQTDITAISKKLGVDPVFKMEGE